MAFRGCIEIRAASPMGIQHSQAASRIFHDPSTAAVEAFPVRLENDFHREVFLLLKKEGLITDFIINNMMQWHHSGFSVYCGKTLWPGNEEGLENLARYIIRASFSSERMKYIPASETKSGAAKVIYQSKSDTSSKTFEALDWLAQLTTHIPNRGEQMVRYYGFYSNKMRGMRKKTGADDSVPALMEPV